MGGKLIFPACRPNPEAVPDGQVKTLHRRRPEDSRSCSWHRNSVAGRFRDARCRKCEQGGTNAVPLGSICGQPSDNRDLVEGTTLQVPGVRPRRDSLDGRLARGAGNGEVNLTPWKPPQEITITMTCDKKRKLPNGLDQGPHRVDPMRNRRRPQQSAHQSQGGNRGGSCEGRSQACRMIKLRLVAKVSDCSSDASRGHQERHH